jgi:cytochrome c551/c552
MGRISAALALSLSLVTMAHATETTGEALFQSMKCNKCHTVQGTPKGPSLPLIANTYGDESSLLLFFIVTSKIRRRLEGSISIYWTMQHHAGICKTQSA